MTARTVERNQRKRGLVQVTDTTYWCCCMVRLHCIFAIMQEQLQLHTCDVLGDDEEGLVGTGDLLKNGDEVLQLLHLLI